jgi:hypothetical protein
MYVKAAFLNGPIKKEVYVEQPPWFEDEESHNHVYKIHKTLCGPRQAPRAWYECMGNFLTQNDFNIGKVDSTLEGSKKATRGVNGSQSKFLIGTWSISQTEPDAPVF